MLRPYANVEEALVELEVYIKELAQRPEINIRPEQIKVGTSSRYRKCHARCQRRGNNWTIIFNLPVLKCNLTNTLELELICKHEVAHVKAPNHGPRFKAVCRQLGIPEEKLVRSRKSSGLSCAKPTHVWKCLRCGDTKNTQREPNTKLKSCDWCSGGYVDEFHKDRARTMMMMTLEESKRYSGSRCYSGFQTVSRYYGLPWKDFAEYVRDGGEFSPLEWFNCMQELVPETFKAYVPQTATANKAEE